MTALPAPSVSQAPPNPARDAAAELAALCGLDMRHFRYSGNDAAPAEFGSHALAMGCELVGHFGRHGAGDGPHGTDVALRDRARVSYAHTAWGPRYRALNAAFLAHEPDRSIPSPLSGREARVLGSVPIGPYQFMLCLDDGRLIVSIGIGNMVVGILYPASNLLLVLTAYPLNLRSILRILLDHVTHRPQAWLGWIRRAEAGALRRAYVIGDNRPGHFVRESLAYLDAYEAEIGAFAAKGGLLLPVPQWCFMDPFTLIPSLAPLERREVAAEALTMTVLLDGYDAHRVYRFGIHPDAAWLRRRFAAMPAPVQPLEEAPAPGRFRVLISLDAERGRVANQEEAFRFVLRRLGAACAAQGRALEVAWDGWTLSALPSERDQEVLARIETAIAGITAGLDVPLVRQIRIFSRSAQEKVPVVDGCDLAFVTRGSGAVVPCWLLQRPTVVYQVASQSQDISCVDPRMAFSIDQRAVEELPPEPPTQHRFALALWGLEEAMQQALGDRLSIETTQPPG